MFWNSATPTPRRNTSMTLADGTTKENLPSGEGVYVLSSPTRGVFIHVTPGGWRLLLRVLRWVLAAVGLYIYSGST